MTHLARRRGKFRDYVLPPHTILKQKSWYGNPDRICVFALLKKANNRRWYIVYVKHNNNIPRAQIFYQEENAQTAFNKVFAVKNLPRKVRFPDPYNVFDSH